MSRAALTKAWSHVEGRQFREQRFRNSEIIAESAHAISAWRSVRTRFEIHLTKRVALPMPATRAHVVDKVNSSTLRSRQLASYSVERVISESVPGTVDPITALGVQIMLSTIGRRRRRCRTTHTLRIQKCVSSSLRSKQYRPFCMALSRAASDRLDL